MSAPMERNESVEPISSNVEKSFVTEKSVRVRNDYGKTPSEKCKLHNPKMAICRELTLVTLNIAAKQSNIKMCCVEALASSGLSAIQWKKKFKDRIHVTAAVSDQLDRLKENCEENELTTTDLLLDFSRTPGTPFTDQQDKEIQVCQCRANVLLHMESFDFIYLDPHKNCSSFIDSVFFNLRHLGILCLVVPDISMFARSHHVVDRYYSTSVIKTDYIKELAARVLIGQLARSASKCNKGIEVLYTMSMDDFLLISVKSHRGPHLADKANQRLQWLLHCRFCEERVFLPKQKAPIENPYNLLPCNCNSEKPGKTAVELGPLWSGPIFNPIFLSKIKSSAQECDLSSKTTVILDTMMEEAGCIIATGENNSNLLDENLNNPNKESLDLKSEEVSDNLRDEKCDNKTSEVSDNQSESVREKSAGEKRLHEDCPDQPAKRLKRANVNNIEETDLWSHPFLPFYYNTHRWKVSHTKLPKVTTLVQLLKSDGYKATKTHFDPKSVRTDANLIQIKRTLDKHCSVKH